MLNYTLDPSKWVKAVLFYDPSRYTKDIADSYIYPHKLAKAGYEVHFVTLGQYMRRNEVSEIIWGFNALFSAFMPRQLARKNARSPARGYKAKSQPWEARSLWISEVQINCRR